MAAKGISIVRDANAATLRQIAALATGSTLAMTFMLPLELVEPEERPGRQATEKFARAAETPFISFFSPQEMLALASRRLSSGPRRASMVAAIFLACGVFMLVRTGGITGDADSDFHWRWTKTPEERLLAQQADEPPAVASVLATLAAAKTGADWPGFRGPNRDGIVRGVRIETDWSKSPPVEPWRQPIGPVGRPGPAAGAFGGG